MSGSGGKAVQIPLAAAVKRATKADRGEQALSLSPWSLPRPLWDFSAMTSRSTYPQRKRKYPNSAEISPGSGISLPLTSLKVMWEPPWMESVPTGVPSAA